MGVRAQKDAQFPHFSDLRAKVADDHGAQKTSTHLSVTSLESSLIARTNHTPSYYTRLSNTPTDSGNQRTSKSIPRGVVWLKRKWYVMKQTHALPNLYLSRALLPMLACCAPSLRPRPHLFISSFNRISTHTRHTLCNTGVRTGHLRRCRPSADTHPTYAQCI
jgi:hypothetical protein